MTVFLYCWYGLASKNSLAHWHSAIFFSEYAIISYFMNILERNMLLSSILNVIISVLLILHHALAFFLSLTVCYLKLQGAHECDASMTYVLAGVAMQALILAFETSLEKLFTVYDSGIYPFRGGYRDLEKGVVF